MNRHREQNNKMPSFFDECNSKPITVPAFIMITLYAPSSDPGRTSFREGIDARIRRTERITIR